MLKRWFPLAFSGEPAAQNGGLQRGTTDEAGRASEPTHDLTQTKPAALATSSRRAEVTKYPDFERIYSSAALKPPKAAYGILKIAEMVNSSHLAGMSPEARRCALLMALEAAGTEIEDLLQDAVVRQKALKDFEHAQQNRLKEFEAVKLEENTRIHAELERITGEYLSRIQANLDEVAHEQDSFHSWQQEKQKESQRITEAAAYCVPQGSAANSITLTGVLERATLLRR